MVDVGEVYDCTIAAIMYSTCVDVRGLYDSDEASRNDVEGILVEEWRVWLGCRGRVVQYV